MFKIYNGRDVFRLVAVLSGGLFLWFTFLSPETVNAALKGNYCLIAFFASLAAYYYTKCNENCTDNEKSDIYRYIESNGESNSREIDRLNDRIDYIRDTLDCGKSVCKSAKKR
jgi:hypothetical protein